MDTHSLKGPRIALLIDFDNVILGVEEPPGFDIELVVTALRSRGMIVLGRAYGDWYRHNRHRRRLMDHGIELVETPAFGPVIKNSADIRIALDAFEIGMTQDHIDEFCLVSGDSDFLPLIKRLQYLGKTVTVISGVKFTSDLVRRNCNEFISYENLLAESVGAAEDATVLEGAFSLLIRTIHTLNERGMEVRSSTVKQMMIQLNPVFSERTFGCTQFKQFLDKACRAGLIRLGRRDSSSGEYTVHLLGENGDSEQNGESELPEAESEPTTRRERSRRARSSSSSKEKEEETGKKEESSSPKAEEEAASDPVSDEENLDKATEEKATGAGRASSSREALRQGRLRSSGRTWKGKAVTRSILQGALNGAPIASAAESEPEKAEKDAGSTEVKREKEEESAEGNASRAEAASTSETETSSGKSTSEEGPSKESSEKEAVVAEETVREEPEESRGKEDTKATSEPSGTAVAETEEDKESSSEPTGQRRKTTKKSTKKSAKKMKDQPDEPTEVAEEETSKPAKKRATKTAAKSAKKSSAKKSVKQAKAAEETAEKTASTETDPAESEEKAEGESEKKAAKKPVRRRTTRKKKEETKSGDAQVENASSPGEE